MKMSFQYLPIMFISVKTIKEETTSSLFHFWLKKEEKGMDAKVHRPYLCIFGNGLNNQSYQTTS